MKGRPTSLLAGRVFVVEERDREERLVVRILRRQRRASGSTRSSALTAEMLNDSISDGRITVTSVSAPLRCTLKVITTRPRMVCAAIGTNQLRRTCEMNRRIHGPNSTPLVSNCSGPNSCVWPFWLLNDSFCTYFCRFFSASPSEPPAGGCSAAAASSPFADRCAGRSPAASRPAAPVARVAAPGLRRASSLPASLRRARSSCRARPAADWSSRARDRACARCDRRPTSRRVPAVASAAGPSSAARTRTSACSRGADRGCGTCCASCERSGKNCGRKINARKIAACTKIDTATPSRRLIADPTGSMSR